MIDPPHPRVEAREPLSRPPNVLPSRVVLLLALAASACNPVKKANAREESQERLPPQVSLHEVRLRSWSGSELAAHGRAAMLTYDRQNTRFVATDGELQLPGRDPDAPSPEMIVRAPVVEGEALARTAHGSGGVTATSSAGMSGRTPSATYDGQAMVARGTEAVEIDGPGYVLDAAGFTFHFVTDALVFDGPVTSTIEEAQR